MTNPTPKTWLTLQPGETWTFIMPAPLEIDGRPVRAGDHVARYFDPSELGRMFRVERVSAPDAIGDERTYETTFVGFEMPTPAEIE